MPKVKKMKKELSASCKEFDEDLYQDYKKIIIANDEHRQQRALRSFQSQNFQVMWKEVFLIIEHPKKSET